MVGIIGGLFLLQGILGRRNCLGQDQVSGRRLIFSNSRSLASRELRGSMKPAVVRRKSWIDNWKGTRLKTHEVVLWFIGTMFVYCMILFGVFVVVDKGFDRGAWPPKIQILVTGILLYIAGFFYFIFFKRQVILLKIILVFAEFLILSSINFKVCLIYRESHAYDNGGPVVFSILTLLLICFFGAMIFLYGHRIGSWITPVVVIWQMVQMVLIHYHLRVNHHALGMKRQAVLLLTITLDASLPLLSLTPFLFLDDVEREFELLSILGIVLSIISIIFLALAYKINYTYYLGTLAWTCLIFCWWPIVFT